MDFNHLVLLIGTNPLPNYVVAKYFLNQDRKLKKISMIHTKEVFAIAQRLQKVLKKEHPTLAFNYWGLTDPGHAALIRKEITKCLQSAGHDNLHLNYTGGTKSMAVQSYRTVFTETGPGQASFSYLDAHDFKLKADDGLSLTGDLREEISIRFEDLLELHDCKKLKPSSEIEWSAANKIIHEFVNQDWVHDFISWKNATIRQIFYENEIFKKPGRVRLDDLKSGKPFYAQAKRLIEAFPPKQAWHFDDKNNLIIPEAKDDFKDFSQGIFYLDGRWLEYYVIELLKQKIREENLKWEMLSNWRIVKGAAEKDFEIDVMVLNGYQLCGISITTARKESECKGKAFEILHRSQQMGGDEARSILVTVLADDQKTKEYIPKKLERDLEFDTGGRASLCILGIKDLKPKELWHRIKKHILGE
jgi:hypothetical protein